MQNYHKWTHQWEKYTNNKADTKSFNSSRPAKCSELINLKKNMTKNNSTPAWYIEVFMVFGIFSEKMVQFQQSWIVLY